jgi:biotin operon repressor
MEQQGWIKLHRRLTEWEWYKNTNTFKLFIHLLISANHKPAKWQGINIERGQFLSGIDSLSRATGLSKQSIRTSIKHLKSTGELTSKSTNKNTLYTIVNYNLYQTIEQEPTSKLTSQLTNDQQATNKQLTTNKNDKKEENENNFAFFWQAYPRKVNKGKAETSYKAALKKATHEVIMKGLDNYKSDLAKKNTSTEYISHAASWLNGGRWADEYEVGKQTIHSNVPDIRDLIKNRTTGV